MYSCDDAVKDMPSNASQQGGGVLPLAPPLISEQRHRCHRCHPVPVRSQDPFADNLLHPYNVKPRDVRVGAKTLKGYYAEDLWDCWERYLPAS